MRRAVLSALLFTLLLGPAVAQDDGGSAESGTDDPASQVDPFTAAMQSDGYKEFEAACKDAASEECKQWVRVECDKPSPNPNASCFKNTTMEQIEDTTTR